MIPYIGGKSLLANWIISNFPDNYKQMSYCEVFGGGGWVLYKKEESYLETYNDLNKNLVNLFRIIRDSKEAFEHKANWTLHSREIFNDAKDKLQDTKFLSEIEKALYFAITRVQSFSGNGNSFACMRMAGKFRASGWIAFLRKLEPINIRLKNVQIECMDFEKLILKYDSPDTLFYCDPPYYDKEFYYNFDGVNFTRNDHERLANLLKKIKGKFVLSYYDNEVIKGLYNDFKIITKKSVKSSYGITVNSRHKKRPKSTELLIMNY